MRREGRFFGFQHYDPAEEASDDDGDDDDDDDDEWGGVNLEVFCVCVSVCVVSN